MNRRDFIKRIVGASAVFAGPWFGVDAFKKISRFFMRRPLVKVGRHVAHDFAIVNENCLYVKLSPPPPITVVFHGQAGHIIAHD